MAASNGGNIAGCIILRRARAVEFKVTPWIDLTQLCKWLDCRYTVRARHGIVQYGIVAALYNNYTNVW